MTGDPDNLGSRVVIPCVTPGLSCCPHRLVATGRPADTVVRCEVWCIHWRVNRIRDKVFHACEPHFEMPEGGEG